MRIQFGKKEVTKQKPQVKNQLKLFRAESELANPNLSKKKKKKELANPKLYIPMTDFLFWHNVFAIKLDPT